MNRLPDSLSSLDVLEQLTDAVIAIDLQGLILFWNRGAERLYEWTAEEALGQSANDLLRTRSAEPLEPLIDSLLREGRWEGELTRARRSGEPVDVLSRWSLLRDPSGNPVARVLIDTDLTETRFRFHELRAAEAEARQRAESLANRESLLFSLVDGITDYAYLKDPESRYLAVNKATAEFFGMKPEDVAGKTDFDFMEKEDAEALVAHDREVFASGGSTVYYEEVRGFRETLHLQTIKTVCHDRDGKVIGLVGISRDMSEHRAMEEKLRQRERDLSEAHRIARLGTWHWDRATDTMTWSDEIYRIFGQPLSYRPRGFVELRQAASAAGGVRPTDEQLSERRTSHLSSQRARGEVGHPGVMGASEPPTHSISLSPLLDAFERAFLYGEPYDVDVEITRADGESRWVVARGEVDCCQDGKVVSLRGTTQDITRHKRLEMELRERERQLKELHRLSGIGTWRYDCATDTVFWSEEIYRIYGVDPSQTPPNLAAMRADAMFTETEHIFLKAFVRAIEFGEPYELDIDVTQADGRVLWIAARGEVEAWKDGKVASLRGTVHEITDRKLNERQIALSENRYRSLVKVGSAIVWVANAQGRLEQAIPEWLAFTGQSESEVLGFGWAEAIHPDDRACTVRAWEKAIEEGSFFEVEQRLRRHDGVYRDMAVRAVPVRDGAGRIVEWVGVHTDITEKKQVQQELRAANLRLQNVLDSITDGLAILDRDLRYTYFNRAGAAALGLLPEDIVGKCLGDFFPSNKNNVVMQEYRRALTTGKPVHFEVRHDDPLHIWAEVHGYPSEQGITVYYRDISERKRTEDALRKSESRFRQLFESDLMGICVPDRFGAFKEGSNEFLRIVGYTREDLNEGLVRWDAMTPAEYRELDAVHIAEAAERGSCTPYEKEYIRKDGTRVPILCGYTLLEGSQDVYIAFVIDLSRQRAAEAELREREQRFRLLAESLPQLVWITDPAGSITYFNGRFIDYLGIAAEQAIGYDWQLMLHPDEMERVNETWSHAVRTGEPYLIELRLRRHDGDFRHFLARAHALRNEAGEIERWVGSCTDVHDQKLAEEALRRSEKLAATGRLAASIAHEINNPLSSVTNALYLALQDQDLDPETRGFLRIAEQELERVTHITTQTLRFHRQAKAAAHADLTETMNSVLTLFGPRLMARRIEVKREMEEGACVTCFDDELRQVFANLVSNSLDATADGGRLRIRVRPTQATSRPGVRVTVADTGYGIPHKVRARIFEPFFSTKDTTGIGLGLWVSDGIIRKHRGRIQLRSSTEGDRHGTVMSLFFPMDGVDGSPGTVAERA
jgi:PAS domain S-box-containing protein